MERRENNFGMIRLLGAFLVICGHMFVLIGEKVPPVLWASVNSAGVAVFFVIGGYLITLSWLREPKFVRYITKRIFRIFPGLIVCVLVTAFVIGPLVTELPVREYLTNRLTWAYLRNCFLWSSFALPGVFAHNPVPGAVNGSLWCLPVEFLMYLIVPVYISLGNKLSASAKKWVYGICTMLIIAAGAIWTTWFYETHYTFLGIDLSQMMCIVPFYFVGIWVALCQLEGFLNLQVAMVVLFLGAGLVYIPVPFTYICQFFSIPYVILSLALAEKPFFATCRLFRSGTLPDISYGMFLFSFVIQQLLIQIFLTRGMPLNVWIILPLTVLISALLGVLTEQLVEKPMGRLCKKLLQKI